MKFREILSEEFQSLNQHICEALGSALQHFQSEEHKRERLDMTDSLHDKIVMGELYMSDKLFDSLVYVYTESQQWGKVNQLMSSVVNKPEICTPDKKTAMYVKRNLLFCFDASTRGQLKNTLDDLERAFFKGTLAKQQQEGGGSTRRGDRHED